MFTKILWRFKEQLCQNYLSGADTVIVKDETFVVLNLLQNLGADSDEILIIRFHDEDLAKNLVRQIFNENKVDLTEYDVEVTSIDVLI